MSDQLSEHFSFREMTHSEGHPEFDAVNQQDASGHRDNLESLCRLILEPLRAKFGALKIDSGFRCDALNRAVGGSPTSQHRFGQAADVNHATDTSDAKKVEMARWLAEELKADRIHFGQALIERGCLHVSLPGGRLGQVGRASTTGGKWHVEPLEAA